VNLRHWEIKFTTDWPVTSSSSTAFLSYNIFMWGRVILGAVIVTLTILWLVAIVLLFLDERTLLQKWQRGLWNSANWPVPTRVLNTEKVGKCPSRICAQKTHSLVSVRI
jgi:hypothetical protein